MISIAHAPNATREQRALARRLLNPLHWPKHKRGSAIGKLEQWFRIRYKVPEAVSFATGREALLAVLQALNIGQGDDVIIQAYTCIVVPHAVLWSGAKPVYADIDDTLNMDPRSLLARLTPKTKAVIVQHTFGAPADIAAIKRICDERNLLLIEDCAHSLGAQFNGKEVGSFGDAAIFSFGRDKVISSTSGGMAIVARLPIGQRLRAIQTAGSYPSGVWIVQNLLHPLLVPLARERMHGSRMGGLLLRLFQAIGLLNKVYTRLELDSVPTTESPRPMPNAMAELARAQLHDQWRDFADHRQQLADEYTAWAQKRGVKYQQIHPASTPAYLRWTCLSQHSGKVLAEARKQGFILGDWYTDVIMPAPHDEALLGYQRGSCPNAEGAAARSINLPTNHLMKLQQVQPLTEILDRIV